MLKLTLLALLIIGSVCLADEPAVAVSPVAGDSVPVLKATADTMFVIPAGPMAGSFTRESRITIADTVAGWAKIFVEGWVPVQAVQDRFTSGATVSTESSPLQQHSADPVIEKKQCAATTQKGSRCKRNARKNSEYCWQHRLK